MLLAVGLLLAVGVWCFLFLPPRRGLWTRTWIAAPVLTAYAVGALAATDRLDAVVGPVTPAEVGLGLGVGGAWLVATHVGHAVLCRLFPSFLAQVNDLYAIRDRSRLWSTVGAVVAMGVAEEVFFRGFVQDRVGLVAAVAAYTAVQAVERKWALALAALLGGTVWGLLFWWSGGLVAPVVAHVLWTGMLTFVWPLKGCDADDPTEEARAGTRDGPAAELARRVRPPAPGTAPGHEPPLPHPTPDPATLGEETR
ncbi:type II CAAX endopeptidase family protein [Iamia majanohamensis]|uniref:Type II CAAX endopeptidase family protein n=1 Tax=Iamia majanohamensis TaxID=467976 RepID=A0AAE9Y6V7_9ACTN|nr:type II CAAX endopeptidase family protein [Iamia majanohamensis]WCO65443.1 type II CAAX endopeptidase family protein [Iamia majanohamensis]